MTGRTTDENTIETLTFPSPTEYVVLRMINKGMRNKEIANELNISIGTTKGHVHNLFLKLRVVNRKNLGTEAKKRGLL